MNQDIKQYTNSFAKNYKIDKEKQEYISFAHRPYFKQSILGKDFISEPYISTDINNYCIAISVPVKNKKYEILGIIIADL